MVVSDKDLGYKALAKQLKDFKKMVIKVGIQTNAGLNKDGTRVVDYATQNEFGDKKIPERSFIRSTSDKKGMWQKEIKEAYTNVIDGKDTPIAALAKVGIRARDDIKQAITDGINPPNSDATIKRKKSSHPLIDTGLLRNSIHYKFEKDFDYKK